MFWVELSDVAAEPYFDAGSDAEVVGVFALDLVVVSCDIELEGFVLVVESFVVSGLSLIVWALLSVDTALACVLSEDWAVFAESFDVVDVDDDVDGFDDVDASEEVLGLSEVALAPSSFVGE